ncbi:hypothetical protein GCM10027429_03770 [Marivirga atlantica]
MIVIFKYKDTFMQTIANNSQYELSADPIRNRAFLTIKGFWRAEEVQDYLSDWEKTLNKLKPGFTLLTDAREMAIHPAEVRDLHKKAQEKIRQAGVKKVAELQKEKVSQMQLDGVSRESAMPKKNFNEQEEALKWLDE